MSSRRIKTAVFALVASIAGSVNAQQASAVTRAECFMKANESAREIRNDTHLFAAGATSVVLSYVGIQVFLLGATAEISPSMLARTSTAGAGFASTTLGVGIFQLFRDGNDSTSQDNLRAFRQTDEYQCLVLEIGRARTEEFISDVIAGWEPRRLAEKYIHGTEYFRVIQLIEENEQRVYQENYERNHN